MYICAIIFYAHPGACIKCFVLNDCRQIFIPTSLDWSHSFDMEVEMLPIGFCCQSHVKFRHLSPCITDPGLVSSVAYF